MAKVKKTNPKTPAPAKPKEPELFDTPQPGTVKDEKTGKYRYE